MSLERFGFEKKKNFTDKRLSKLKIDLKEIKKSLNNKESQNFYLPWFMKYQVMNYEDLIKTKELEVIENFFKNYENSIHNSKKQKNLVKNKGILLIGPPGSGKTTTIHLLSEKYNFEILEVNASDTRNKNAINEIVLNFIKQKSLFNKKKIVLFDEIDGISGTADRGGLSEIIKILKNFNIPFIFTANDETSNKIKTLKKYVIVVNFFNSSNELLKMIAKKIFKNENVSFDEKDLKNFIIERSKFDIRGFINDLQASVIDKKFNYEGIEIRDYKKRINDLLKVIFYSYPEDSYEKIQNTDINLDDLILYLEKNTPLIYKDALTLFKSFNELSKADIFRRRIMRWQHWRFLVYISFYSSFGISNAKNEKTKIKKVNLFLENKKILEKWIFENKFNFLNNEIRNDNYKTTIKNILKKSYSLSDKRIIKDGLIYFLFIYKNDKNFRNNFNKEFNLDKELELKLLNLENYYES